jgi:hypothetical protein
MKQNVGDGFALGCDNLLAIFAFDEILIAQATLLLNCVLCKYTFDKVANP